MTSRSRPYSAVVLALGGALLMGLGLFFVFLRPPLLPEDPRFMGTSLETIEANVPGLLLWLPRVFWVMGGFIFSTGLLTVYLALFSFRQRTRGAAAVAALTGLASMGWMAAVNFMIASDFRWLLLAFTSPWAAALVLYWVEGTQLSRAALGVPPTATAMNRNAPTQNPPISSVVLGGAGGIGGRHTRTLAWGRIAAWSLGLNAVWESLQCGFLYDMGDRGFWRSTVWMWGAIFGDVLIVLGVAALAARLGGAGRLAPPDAPGWSALLGVGFVAAVALEWAAQALGLWGYTVLMPTLLVFGREVGLSPIVQVAVLPVLCVRLATCSR